ncbi:MAG: xanthine dehydrogenase family protein subunit M [Chloroflexota bacterium]
MKPAPFDYYAPTTLDEALSLISQYGYDAKPLAGGQSLVPVMNFRLAQPSVIIDLNRIDKLFDFSATSSKVTIGSMTRMRTLELDSGIAEYAPLITEALPKVAYPQIRTRGTMGGSLAHADPSAELPAVALALGAKLELQNKTRSRWVNAEDYYQALFTTAIQPDELLTRIEIPSLKPNSGWSIQEVSRRHHDFAMAGAAAFVELDSAGICQQARLVFFSVTDYPMLASQVVSTLVGQKPTKELIEEVAASTAAKDIDPSEDIHATADYRRHLARVISGRVLSTAFDRAKSNGR